MYIKLQSLSGTTMYDQKIPLSFSFRFYCKSMFVWHLICKNSSFKLYRKAVFFECKFRISLSAIVHGQNWLKRVGPRIRWGQRLTSLKLQGVNAAYIVNAKHVKSLKVRNSCAAY